MEKLIIICPLIFVSGILDAIVGGGALISLPTYMACGNARIVNCSLNFIAMITFLISGKIMFEIAIPAAICSILGNYIGAGLAIKKENKIVKPLFIAIFLVLFIKLIYDVVDL